MRPSSVKWKKSDHIAQFSANISWQQFHVKDFTYSIDYIYIYEYLWLYYNSVLVFGRPNVMLWIFSMSSQALTVFMTKDKMLYVLHRTIVSLKALVHMLKFQPHFQLLLRLHIALLHLWTPLSIAYTILLILHSIPP